MQQPASLEVLVPVAIAGVFAVSIVVLLAVSFLEDTSSLPSFSAAAATRLGQLSKALLSPYFKWRGTYPHVVTDAHMARVSQLLVRELGYSEDGVFVDVGAGDGESGSYTAMLADVGWRGVCAEAVPEAARACRARHAGNKEVSGRTPHPHRAPRCTRSRAHSPFGMRRCRSTPCSSARRRLPPAATTCTARCRRRRWVP